MRRGALRPRRTHSPDRIRPQRPRHRPQLRLSRELAVDFTSSALEGPRRSAASPCRRGVTTPPIPSYPHRRVSSIPCEEAPFAGCRRIVAPIRTRRSPDSVIPAQAGIQHSMRRGPVRWMPPYLRTCKDSPLPRFRHTRAGGYPAFHAKRPRSLDARLRGHDGQNEPRRASPTQDPQPRPHPPATTTTPPATSTCARTRCRLHLVRARRAAAIRRLAVPSRSHRNPHSVIPAQAGIQHSRR
ncbi:hypothetical protein EDC25_103174 [Pseudofulvimonas gallinarii]|uniref:Uncharacterized protein n=1 Tax=Pseudofulvimonas gallinarii TaxID=634155 RepID=A0A4R3LLF0_9GAMM|nr:hypothetical protein EDC25_103174 [Pseudofulvimonas gallinarii]